MSDQLPAKVDEAEDGKPAIWNPFEERGQFAIHTTLPSRSKEERAAVVALRNADWVRGNSLINTEFEISHYIAHPVSLVDKETGELVPQVRLVFPQLDGKPIAFVSNGVLGSMRDLVFVTGREPPWDPPIRVKLLRLPSSPPNFIFKLEYVSG